MHICISAYLRFPFFLFFSVFQFLFRVCFLFYRVPVRFFQLCFFLFSKNQKFHYILLFLTCVQCRFWHCSDVERAAQCISGRFSASGSIREAKWRPSRKRENDTTRIYTFQPTTSTLRLRLRLRLRHFDFDTSTSTLRHACEKTRKHPKKQEHPKP